MHTGNGRGHFALANSSLLRSYHGEGAWSCCVSLCTVCYVLPASNFARLGARVLARPFLLVRTLLGALQYSLGYVCKCKSTSYSKSGFRYMKFRWEKF